MHAGQKDPKGNPQLLRGHAPLHTRHLSACAADPEHRMLPASFMVEKKPR